MYLILGLSVVTNKDSGDVVGYKVHLVEHAFSSVSEGYGVMSYYFSLNKIHGDIAVGSYCDIMFVPGNNGSYPAALVVK